MRRTIRSRKTRAQRADISLTPLIDTALTLLIIFMIATPMMYNAIRVTLPRGQAKEDVNVQQELVVYVDKGGGLFLNKQSVDAKMLIEQIKEIVGKEQEKTVYIKADQAASYGTVLELVDQIKVVGGVKYVALATQKCTQTTPALG